MNIRAADSVAAPTAALVVALTAVPIVALPETELVSVAHPDKNLETDTVADNLREKFDKTAGSDLTIQVVGVVQIGMVEPVDKTAPDRFDTAAETALPAQVQKA